MLVDCWAVVWTLYISYLGLHGFDGTFYSYVITPYNEYPQLLGLLLKLLNGELAWSTRREVLKVWVPVN